MPDHFHGIVFVREPQAKPLGRIVGAFKSHSSSLYMAAQAPPHAARGKPQDGEAAQAPPHAARGKPQNRGALLPPASVVCPAACGMGGGGQRPPSLWFPGYQDTILFRKALANMRVIFLITSTACRQRAHRAVPDCP